MTDRLADLTLVAFLGSAFWYGQFVWQNEISRTRELVLLYCLIGLTAIRRPWREMPRMLWVAGGSLLLLTVLGFTTWMIQLNSALAINYWGENLSIAAILLFGMTFGQSRWPVWRVIFLVSAVLIALFQLVALLARASSVSFVGSGPAFYEWRPVGASLTLLVLLGFILTLTDTAMAGGPKLALGAFLGISVAVAQHRSVWVAMLITLTLLLVARRREPEGGAFLAPLLVTIGFFAASLLMPLLGFSVLPGAVSQSEGLPAIPESATDAGTLAWRIEMWESRLAASRSPMQWLMGSSLGQTPAFGPSSDVMNKNISAHNTLLDVQLMHGLVGLAIVALIFLIAVRHGVRFDPLTIFLWGLLGYGLFYLWPAWSWAVLGVAARLAMESSGHDPERQFTTGTAPGYLEPSGGESDQEGVT